VKASEDEFGQFVAATSLALLKTARLLTGDWHLGQDLLQVTLTKVYLHWEHSSRWDSAIGYARKVMVNTYCTWARRRWRHELSSEVVPDAGDGRDVAEAVAVADAFAAALLSLPRRHRAVLVLRFYEDLSVEQTAAVLGCPAGTVMSLTSRALARLRASPHLLGYHVLEGR
jgi:RNA polymerase sigma-70 factor, ECF subfamily